MPVRRLHNFIYCPRLFYYQWVENIFQENADTVEGSHAHRNVDQPSRVDEEKLKALGENLPEGARLRSLRLESETLGLIGVVDLIEGGPDGAEIIDYKKGAARRNSDNERVAKEPDAIQVAAHALLLREIGINTTRAAIYYAADKRRVSVELSEELFVKVRSTIEEARAVAASGRCPPPLKNDPRCLYCSAYPICLPNESYWWARAGKAIKTCLELGVDVAYFSPAGRFLGTLRGLPVSGVDARRGQYRLFELPGVRLQLAREVVRAKIHNQRTMLMRNGDVPDRVLQLLAGFRDATESARDINELLGLEGTAAALYFEQFESMLKERGDWKFDWRGRNRRPPRDPVNALLSLGYSMLAKELTGVCDAVGLDPFLGFMHQPRYGRPALALDLMEEFRPLIADSVAISLVNRGELGPDDFIRSASGTFLNERGRRAFWEAWFRRLDAEVSHPQFAYKMAYRRMLEVQARQLWRFLRGEAATYHGFTTR